MHGVRGLVGAVLLLLLTLEVTAVVGDSPCPRTSPEEAAELRDTLRQTACDLNFTSAQMFHSQIRAKHGMEAGRGYFASGRFFQSFPIKVWCRRSCTNVTAENITWCINIANFDHHIETCISPSSVNSSCEAQLVGLESFISLPSDCAIAGGVGCLGLTNMDWYFKNAYLTCTVNTDTCYEKSFTFVHALPSTVTEPLIEAFPKSPLNATNGSTIVLHAEATSTTDRIHISWRHGNTMYTQYIREDPFCNPQVENCLIDRHPNATNLRRQRVRLYWVARLTQLTGCQNPILYRISSYLIINSSNITDGGDYMFNITSRYSTGSETVLRQVTVVIDTSSPTTPSPHPSPTPTTPTHGPEPVTLTLLPVGRGDSVFEGGDGVLEVCVEVVSGIINSEFPLRIRTGNQEADVNDDLLHIYTEVSLYPGDAVTCWSFDAIWDDNLLEESETFSLAVDEVNYSLETRFIDSYRSVTIVNDEIAYVGFTQSSYSVEEGSGMLDVCIELQGDEESYLLGKPLSLRLSSDGETAEAGADFSLISQIVYFPPGSGPGNRTCVSIPIIDDSLEEQTEAFNVYLFVCDTAVAVTRDTAIGIIIDDDRDVPTDRPTPSEATPTSGTDAPSSDTPLPTETPTPPASLEVYFAEDTPHIEGTTISFVPSTNIPASLSCHLEQEEHTCTAGETTVITDLTPGETYTLRLVATTDDDRAKMSIKVHIPAHSGSCYVHTTNKGLQLIGNGLVLDFSSVGPVTGYTCSLNRAPGESCTSPHTVFLSGLSGGRHRLVITPVGALCSDVDVLPFTFNI